MKWIKTGNGQYINLEKYSRLYIDEVGDGFGIYAAESTDTNLEHDVDMLDIFKTEEKAKKSLDDLMQAIRTR